ncbi:MAG: hypothetical protein WKF94_00655 [Solirubrobacteraceae bacterium]
MPALPPVVAAAAAMTVEVPSTLGGDLDRAKDKTSIAVLLPQATKTELPESFGNLNAATSKRSGVPRQIA